MKKLLIVGALLASFLLGQTVSAGDREWATAGKILTGVAVIHTIDHIVNPPRPTIIYQQPVVVQQPIVYQQPVVVAAPVVYVQPTPVYYYYYYAPPPPVVVRYEYRQSHWYHRR